MTDCARASTRTFLCCLVVVGCGEGALPRDAETTSDDVTDWVGEEAETDSADDSGAPADGMEEDGAGRTSLPECPDGVLGAPHTIFAGQAANGVRGVASGDDDVAVLLGDGSGERLVVFDRAGELLRSTALPQPSRASTSSRDDLLLEYLAGAGSECERETHLDVAVRGGESMVDSGAGRQYSLDVPLLGGNPVRSLALGPGHIIEFDVEWMECYYPDDIVDYTGHVRLRDRAEPSRLVAPDDSFWYARHVWPIGAATIVGDRPIVLSSGHVATASVFGPPDACNEPDLCVTVFDSDLRALGLVAVSYPGNSLHQGSESLAGGRSSALVAGIRDDEATGWTTYHIVAVDVAEDRVPQVVAEYDLEEWVLRYDQLRMSRAALAPAGGGFALVAANSDEARVFQDVVLLLLDAAAGRVAEIPLPTLVPPVRDEVDDRGFAVASSDRCVDVVASVGVWTGTGINDQEVTLQSYCCPAGAEE